ncbi:MAG: MMPL family transporter [Gammaproteobacteria bacterium]|nr:MMPL family transporter [Gammaproteobacteria bacterium]
MKNLTNKIDSKMRSLGFFIARWPKSLALLIVLIVVAIASNLPKTTVDTSTEGFLHESSQMIVDYDAFRDQFGRDEKIVVAIKADNIFELETLNKIRDLHNELKSGVPYLNDITSLINARNTVGTEDSLLVDDLLAEWPTDKQQLEAIKKTVINNPMYKNLLINEQGTFSVIIMESNTYTSLGNESVASTEDAILDDELGGFDEPEVSADIPQEKREFLSDAENTAMVVAATKIVEKYNAEGFELQLAGSPSVTAFLKSSMKKDMAKFIVMIIVAIIIFLALLFKRASGVFLPILTVVLAVLSTMGLMAFFGTPIKIMTQILPSFLLAVGVGASVHILAIFYKKYDQTKDKVEAIAYTLEHSGFAVIMTSLTTAAGMASFAASEVAPVADLGIYSASGVMISLLFSLILLPALLIIVPVKAKHYERDDDHHDTMDKILTSIAHFSQDHAKRIVIVSLVFMAITIALGTQIRYSHNPLKWFPEDHSVRVATEIIDDKMKGSISLELVVDTAKPNGLYDIKVLKGIESLTQYAETIKEETYFVGKAISIVDVLKEIHKALNENRESHYALAENADLISQEILLFENSGSDDLEDFVDSQFSMARITVKVPWIDAFEYHGLLESIAQKMDENFDESIKITTTGMIPLLAKTISAAVESSGKSYLIAFVVISLMMMMLLYSVKLGLLSMIPNLFPIFFILSVMVVLSLPLDLFTMLIGAIVIGIAVDDIVHFMHNFRRYHQNGMTTRDAVVATLTSTGRAMTITTIVLFVGFFLYMFASLSNLFLFGLLTAIAFAVALLSVLFLAPAIMALVYPDHES